MSNKDTSFSARLTHLNANTVSKFRNNNDSSTKGNKYLFSPTEVIYHKIGVKTTESNVDQSLYTITYDGNMNTEGDVPVDPKEYHVYNPVRVLLPSTLLKTNYTFNSWNTEADGSGKTYFPRKNILLSENTTLYAIWEPTYNITYVDNDNVGTVPDDLLLRYTNGTKITLRSPSNIYPGYSFINWNTEPDYSGESYPLTRRLTITDSITLYAKWSSAFTVTYVDVSNLGTLPSDPRRYTHVDTFRVNGNMTNVNYRFDGWFNGEGTPYFLSIDYEIRDNITLYARWTPKYTVTYYKNNNSATGTVADPESPYASGTTNINVLTNTFVLEKHAFDGWYTNSTYTGDPVNVSFTITANVELYAKWRRQYSVTYDKNATDATDTVPTDTTNYELNRLVVINTTVQPERPHFEFSGWTKSGETNTITSFSITQDTILTAKWTNIYSVTYYKNDDLATGSVTDSNTYYSGNTVTIQDGTNLLFLTGNRFKGWTTDPEGTVVEYPNSSTQYSYEITQDVSFYAVWKQLYTLTYEKTESGATISQPFVNVTTHETGDMVPLLDGATYYNFTNHRFKGWRLSTSSDVDYTVGTQLPITSHITLYAVWRQLFTVTYYKNTTETTINVPVDDPHESNTDVDVLSWDGERDNYTFLKWRYTLNGNAIDYFVSDTISNITSNMDLYAVWDPKPYKVSFSGTFTGGNFPNEEDVPYGNIYTLPGNTRNLENTGNTLVGWSIYGSSSVVTTYPITAPITFYAVWTRNPYTLTYNQNVPDITMTTLTLDDTQLYNTPVTVKVLPSAFAIYGYDFTKWNTLSDGTGTDKSEGANFTILENSTLYSIWQIRRYTVSYNLNTTDPTGTTGTLPDSVTDDYKTIITIPENTGSAPLDRVGYTFQGWNTLFDGTGTTYNTQNNTFPLIGNTPLYVKWEAISYTVTYHVNGGEGDVPTEPNHIYKDQFLIKAKPSSLQRTRNTFDGWNTIQGLTSTTNKTTGDSFDMPANNVILYAKWKCTLTYDAKGGTGAPSPTIYPNGTPITNITPSKTISPTFGGWYDNPEFTGSAYTTFNITEDITLYAKWRCRLTYVPNGGIDAPSETYYTNGAPISYVIPTKSVSPNFGGWYDNPGFTGSAYTTFNITQDTTLYAKWICSVTFRSNYQNDQTDVSSSNQPYVNGSLITTNTTGFDKIGNSFHGWYDNTDGTGNNYYNGATLITMDITLYAKWTDQTYTVTYYSDNNRSKSVVDTYTKDATVIVRSDRPIINGIAWTNSAAITNGLNGWTTLSGTTYYTYSGNTFDITSNVELYPVWASGYSMRYTTAGSSFSIDTPQSPYCSGKSIILKGPTDFNFTSSGKTFFKWGYNSAVAVAANRYSPGNTYTIQNSNDFHAMWGYKVTYNGNGTTTNVPTEEVGFPGEGVTSKTQNGMSNGTLTFDGWITGQNYTGTTYAISTNVPVSSSDITLYAVWTGLTATFSNSGATSGISQLIPYKYSQIVPIPGNVINSTVNLILTDKTFYGWNDGVNNYVQGNSYPSSAPTTGLITNVTFTAVWGVSITYYQDATSDSPSYTVPTVYIPSQTYDVLAGTHDNFSAFDVTGKTITSWTEGSTTGTSRQPGYQYNIDSNTVNIKLYAVWTDTYYTLTYYNGTTAYQETNTILKDTLVTVRGRVMANATKIVNSTNSNFGLAGWANTPTGAAAYDPYGTNSNSLPKTFTIRSNTNLNAVWGTVAGVTVAYTVSNGAAAVTDQNSPYVSGKTVTVLAPTNPDGYTFNRWQLSGTSIYYNPANTFNIASATTLIAQWTGNTIVMSYDTNSSSSITNPDDRTHTYAQSGECKTADLSTLTYNSKTFAGWNESVTPSYTGSTISSTMYEKNKAFSSTTFKTSKKLYAVWGAQVTYVAESGHTVTNLPGSSVYITGQTISLPTNPSRDGYDFSLWKDSSGTTVTFPISITESSTNVTLTAYWTAKQITLTYAANSGTGNASTTPATHTYAQTANFTTSDIGNLAFTNKTFAGWNESATPSYTGNPLAITSTMYAKATGYASTTFTTSKTLNAIWGAQVTYVAASGQTVTNLPVSSVYINGQTILSPTSPSRDGYNFSVWKDSGGTTVTFPISITANSINFTLTAYWTAKSITLTYVANSGTGNASTPTATHTYAQATNFTTSDTGNLALTNKTFAGWNESSTPSYTGDPLTITSTMYAKATGFPSTTFTTSKTLYAIWGAKVTYAAASGDTVTNLPPVSSVYINGQTIPVSESIPSKATDPKIFIRWNNGSDAATAIVVDSTTTNKTYTAVWGYTITYNPNGATGGSVPSVAKVIANASYTVVGNTGGLINPNGISFGGWIDSDPFQTDNPGTIVTNISSVTSNRNLYAVWPITVIFDANGGTIS